MIWEGRGECCWGVLGTNLRCGDNSLQWKLGNISKILKTDCVILFLSQVVCGWCSRPSRRDRGEWLRREPVEFAHSSPTGLCFVLVQGRMEGEERTLLLHLKNKDVF